jgi:plasmid stabilization system protein ParE
MAKRYSKEYRAMVFGNHLVFYRYEPGKNQVTTVAILDGRRDLAALLAEIDKEEG